MSEHAKTLALLGLTTEQLQNRVIARICDDLLRSKSLDEDGEEYACESKLQRELEKRVREAIDAKVAALAEAHVYPKVSEMTESLVLQKTNQWGEKVGKPQTFVEYLVARAEAYMVEKVNYAGKSKSESGGYSWTASQTRVTHLIHEHLHYSIETAMAAAVSSANGQIAKGIQSAVEIALNDIVGKIECEVRVPR